MKKRLPTRAITLLTILLGVSNLLCACASPQTNIRRKDTTVASTIAPESKNKEAANGENSRKKVKEESFKEVAKTPTVMGLKGPTGISLAPFMNQVEKQDLNYQFAILSTPDQMVPKIVKGEADIACLPANLAAKLYQKTGGKISVIGINTLGTLYILERGNEVHDIADLKGKVIYSPGKGATPEYALTYLLEQAGLQADDVNIQWESEPTQALADLAQDEKGLALLPQPFACLALNKIDDLRPALDLNKVWDKSQETAEKPSSLVMGVYVAQKDLIKNQPELIQDFLKRANKSADFVNHSVDKAATLVDKYGIVKEAVAKQAIPYCHIVHITGEDMLTALDGYLQILFENNPQAIGGKMPEADFYYCAK